MKKNMGKTKVTEINSKDNIGIRITGGRIEKVKKYKCLETMLTEDCKSAEEIKRRIPVAKEAFTNNKKLLCNKNL